MYRRPGVFRLVIYFFQPVGGQFQHPLAHLGEVLPIVGHAEDGPRKLR